jgi:hypothetical protein
MMNEQQPIPFSLAKARELLKRAVATQGRKFVYNQNGMGMCYYLPQTDAPDNSPKKRTGCLIGTMFTLAGVPAEVLEQNEHAGVRVVLRNLQNRDIIDIAGETDIIDEYLTRAQTQQDTGATWGEAYDYAEQYPDYAEQYLTR